MTTTVADVLKSARAEHPSFTVERHPNVVAVSYLSTRHRLLFKDVAHDLRDRLSQARSIAAKVSGSLVSVDENGVPSVIPPSVGGSLIVGDVVNIGGDGVPYLGDQSTTTDPTQGGFQLPAESLELIDIYATLTDGVNVPVIWRPMGDAPKLTGLSGLIAVVAGWRLVPIKNPKDLTTFWDQVVTVTVVWVDEPVPLTDLTSPLTIPSSYGRALEYEMAAYFARREGALTKDFPPTLVAFFEQQAAAERAATIQRTVVDHMPLKRITTKRNR